MNDNMDIMDNGSLYDEDNIDLEEQMYLQDIQEEIEESEKDSEVEEEYVINFSKDFFKNELKIKAEEYRHKLKFSYDGIVYEGIVVSALNKDRYIFNICEEHSKEKMRLKAFNIANIKKVK